MAQWSNVVENYSCYNFFVTSNFHISADLTNCAFTLINISFCLVFFNGFDGISYFVDIKTGIFLFKKIIIKKCNTRAYE